MTIFEYVSCMYVIVNCYDLLVSKYDQIQLFSSQSLHQNVYGNDNDVKLLHGYITHRNQSPARSVRKRCA